MSSGSGGGGEASFDAIISMANTTAGGSSHSATGAPSTSSLYFGGIADADPSSLGAVQGVGRPHYASDLSIVDDVLHDLLMEVNGGGPKPADSPPLPEQYSQHQHQQHQHLDSSSLRGAAYGLASSSSNGYNDSPHPQQPTSDDTSLPPELRFLLENAGTDGAGSLSDSAPPSTNESPLNTTILNDAAQNHAEVVEVLDDDILMDILGDDLGLVDSPPNNMHQPSASRGADIIDLTDDRTPHQHLHLEPPRQTSLKRKEPPTDFSDHAPLRMGSSMSSPASSPDNVFAQLRRSISQQNTQQAGAPNGQPIRYTAAVQPKRHMASFNHQMPPSPIAAPTPARPSQQARPSSRNPYEPVARVPSSSPGASARPAPSTSDVIDLTDESASVAETERIRLQQEHQNQLVCFGVIHTFVTKLHPEVFDQIRARERTEIRVKLQPFMTASSRGIYSIQVQTMHGQPLGFLEDRVASVLSVKLDKLRMDAFLPKMKVEQKFVSHVQLVLYGPRQFGPDIGLHLRRYNLELRPINVVSAIPYENPHAASVFNSRFVVSSEPNNDEANSQIEAVYQALSSAEDLKEMEPDPHVLTPMYKHQKQALCFLTEKEMDVDFRTYDPKRSMWKLDNNTFKHLITNEKMSTTPRQVRGGILADDMGLGKTIETISLIVTSRFRKEREEQKNNARPLLQPFGYSALAPITTRTIEDEDFPEKGSMFRSKGTLIVCPLSTVHNWEEQFAAHITKDLLNITVYHGPGRVQSAEALAAYDIVITTYNLLSTEYSKDVKAASTSGGGKDGDPVVPLVVSSPLQSIYWERVVLDEAHIIKDPNTSQSKAACFLSAYSRWCLTGTPIQNRLDDLYSLIKFIRLAPFSSKNAWNLYISKPIKFAAHNNIGVHRLQTLMKSITLRRTKQQKIDGKPILTLPERRDEIRTIHLSPQEQAIYTSVHQKAFKYFQKLKNSGSVMKHYVHILEMILRLRQICVHPHLFKDDRAVAEWDKLTSSADDDTLPPLTRDRALHLISLLREAADDKCCNCNVLVDVSAAGGGGGGGNGGFDGSANSTSGLVPGNSLCVARCGHLFCTDCMGEVISSPVPVPCPMCGVALGKADILEVKENESGELDEESGSGKDGAALRSGGLQSSKIKSLIDDLVRVRQQHMARSEEQPKSVIFSQWTSVLDLVETPLTEAGFQYHRLDGAMKRVDRASAMEQFKTDPKVTVLLISLKAGGVGLNLTAASRVYIIEPYWNPAVEQQAVDRVHRMGQRKVVDTVRFIAKGTIEENIIALQKRKMELAQMAFKEGKAAGGKDDGVDGLGAKGKRREKARENKEAMQQQKLLDLQLLFE
ncbi:SNF2 family N-terminal domain-containing protein [Zopfochytrium polystomum]|nr:SNF2 family N-terminal domain-containing protein [Zopfochytrium polystomum]